MKVLVTGSNGQVGWEIQRALAPFADIAAFDRVHLDLGDSNSIRQALHETRPDIIVNAAAYTAVDKAESEPELAMRINGVAPGILAEEAKRLGAMLIHYSTDYVFDGSKDGAYVENDRVNPINIYGRSKLAGEEAIRAAGAPHLIFRTSWVYAARGSNFVRTMLRLGRERPELKIVDDQIGAPTWARSIADMTAKALRDPDKARERSGTYHLTSQGAATWFGFACTIFDEAKTYPAAFKPPVLTPIPTSAYPLPARRPSNSRLDTSKLTEAFGINPPAWETALKECLSEIRNM